MNGLLLLTGNNNFDNFLAIRLVNGMVMFSFRNVAFMGRQATTTSSYSDGQIHTLQFTHYRRDINFIVDGRDQPMITGEQPGENWTSL